jgi:molybdopterin molybdotransferase
VAALLLAQELVLPLLERLMGCVSRRCPVPAAVTESVSANHGRAQLMGVRLQEENGLRRAVPIRGKSGLITTLAGAEGYFEIPRDREGVAAGEQIEVFLL